MIENHPTCCHISTPPVTPGFWPPCVNPEEVVLHPKVKKGKRYRKYAGIGLYAGVSGWSLVQWKE